MIHQGEIYWLDLEEPRGSEPGYRRPCVVVQNDLLNRSRLSTVLVCGLTSNMRRAKAPGNLALAKGEGGLPKASVVNVTQVFTMDRDYFGEPIGSLSREQLDQVLAGIRFVIEPRDIDSSFEM